MRLAHPARLGLIVTLAALIGLLSGTVTLVGQGSFAATDALGIDRTGHTATLLDDGRVFVAGGFGSAGLLASTEIYGPATGVFSAGSSLSNTLVGPRAVKLPDGRVLIVGGFDGASATTAVDLFDPSTGAITAAAAMTTPRSDASVTLLDDGTVLVAGGFSGGTSITDTAEIYDSATNTWTATGPLIDAREAHTATLLSDGTVLLTGGQGDLATETVLSSSEIYDPATGTFAAVGAMGAARYFHTATFLPTAGLVLVAGGLTAFDLAALTASVEVYDPALGVWASLSDMLVARAQHTASLLRDDPRSILIFGGDAATGGSVERYPTDGIGTIEVADPVLARRNDHSATTLSDGSVLIAGGDDASSTFYSAAEIYTPDTVDEPPVDEPPVDEPPVTPTFAAFADIALTSASVIAYELPPGLSLVSFTGIPESFAELAAEAGGDPALLSTQQTDDIPIIQGVPWLIDDVIVTIAGDVRSIFDPNSGRSYTDGAPGFVNTLRTMTIGSYWINMGPQGGFWLQSYLPGPRTVTVPGAGFYAFPYTGPAGRPIFADEVRNLDRVFSWRALLGLWESYTPGAPDFVNKIDKVFYGIGLIAIFSGPTSFVLGAAGLIFGLCAGVLPAGEDDLLINPDFAGFDLGVPDGLLGETFTDGFEYVSGRGPEAEAFVRLKAARRTLHPQPGGVSCQTRPGEVRCALHA